MYTLFAFLPILVKSVFQPTLKKIASLKALLWVLPVHLTLFPSKLFCSVLYNRRSSSFPNFQDAVRVKSQPSYQKYSQTSIEVVSKVMLKDSLFKYFQKFNTFKFTLILAYFAGALLHFTWAAADKIFKETIGHLRSWTCIWNSEKVCYR